MTGTGPSTVEGRLGDALPFRTRRLVLRELVAGDRDAVHAYRSIPEVSRYLGVNGADPADFERWWAKRISAGDGGWLAVAVELEGRVIGDAGLRLSEAPSVAGPTGEREGYLGYAFDPAVGGRGYARETCAAMLHIGFEGLGLRRITADVFAGHMVSSHILAAEGFRHEGTSVRKVFNREGTWFDDEHWAMLADEWRARHRAQESGAQVS